MIMIETSGEVAEYRTTYTVKTSAGFSKKS